MDVDVLIPWRTDRGERERLFDWVLPRWLAAGVRVVVGGDDSAAGRAPFNVSRAFNDAFEGSTAPAVMMYGADHIPDPAKVAFCGEALEHLDWIAGYATTGQLGKEATEAVLLGADPTQFPFVDVFGFCTGILAMRREVFEQIGGMDERFEGWGCEDTAIRAALVTCFPNTLAPMGIARALFHEKAPRDEFAKNAVLVESEYGSAVGNPPKMWAALHRAKEYRYAMGTLGSSR